MAKSAVARGASMAASVWSKLDGKVKARGGTEDAIHILDKPEGDALLDSIAEQLVEAELKTRDRFPITINYHGLTLEHMIAECGCDYNNPNITAANFPITPVVVTDADVVESDSKTGKLVVEEEVIIVHFNKYISSENAITELAKMGLEPARIEHALAFGKKYPNAQRKYPIVFLGSSCVIYGNRHVPYLCRHDSLRCLYLNFFDFVWFGSYRFAAVRTKTK